MRSYKIMISSHRKHFLVDLKSNILSDDAIYYVNSTEERTYLVIGNESRTIEEGKYYYLDRTCILCSEDMTSNIYK